MIYYYLLWSSQENHWWFYQCSQIYHCEIVRNLLREVSSLHQLFSESTTCLMLLYVFFEPSAKKNLNFLSLIQYTWTYSKLVHVWFGRNMKFLFQCVKLAQNFFKFVDVEYSLQCMKSYIGNLCNNIYAIKCVGFHILTSMGRMNKL